MLQDLEIIHKYLQRNVYSGWNISFDIHNYKGINDNPKAVNSILYSGLCANAIASFKW